MGLSDWLFQSEEEDDASADWPSATGEVHSAEVHVRSRDVYTAEISYFYSARGEYYSGYLQHHIHPRQILQHGCQQACEIFLCQRASSVSSNCFYFKRDLAGCFSKIRGRVTGGAEAAHVFSYVFSSGTGSWSRTLPSRWKLHRLD